MFVRIGMMMGMLMLLSPENGIDGASGSSSPSSPSSGSSGESGANPSESTPSNTPSSATDGAAELEKLRAEHAKAQKELEKLRAAEEERKKAQMSELERAKTEAAEAKAKAEAAEARVAEQKKHNALLAEAQNQGLKNPSLYLRLVDMSGIDIDDKGDVKGVSTAIANLKKLSPELFGESKGSSTTNGENLPKGQEGKGKGAPLSDREKGRAMAKLVGKEKRRLI